MGKLDYILIAVMAAGGAAAFYLLAVTILL